MQVDETELAGSEQLVVGGEVFVAVQGGWKVQRGVDDIEAHQLILKGLPCCWLG